MSKDTAETDGPAKKGKLPLIIAIVVALLAGGGGGAFLGGKLLAADPAPAKGGEAAPKPEASEEPSGPLPPAYTIDNLVLNPAGTEGTRFLMLTLSLSPRDEAATEVLKERDPELRDAVLRLLERKTIPELADVTRRDSLKTEIQATLAKELPKGTLRNVYLPQFVIQ
jgi:flagellar FliL protein